MLYWSILIFSYNLVAEVELTDRVQESDVIIAARDADELFAKVPLNEELTEDTDAGAKARCPSQCLQ